MDAPEMGLAMSRSCQNDAKDEKASSEDNARPTSQLINDKPKSEHAKNFADEIGIRQAGLDGRRNTIGIPGAAITSQLHRYESKYNETYRSENRGSIYPTRELNVSPSHVSSPLLLSQH